MLVLTVLAIVVVISLPYLLNWFEPAAPPRVARQAEPPKPAPSATPPAAVAPAPAPSAPTTAAAPQESKPAPAVTPAPKAASAPPATPAPAPKAVAEKPAAPAPARKAETEKAPAPTPVRKAEVEKPAAKTSEKAASKTPADKAPVKAAEKASDKPAAPSRVVAKADTPSRPATAVASAKASPASVPSGNYWIQLGAFKEEKNAEALAKALRDEGFPVQITPIRRGANDGPAPVQQHELFVSEAGVEKVNAALKGKGTGQVSAGGVAVRPAFSLQEAMTVSKRLTDEGFKVVIRPASGPATTSQGTLHAVRVGGYTNQTSAVAARDELSAKGHRGFLAEGPAK